MYLLRQWPWIAITFGELKTLIKQICMAEEALKKWPKHSKKRHFLLKRFLKHLNTPHSSHLPSHSAWLPTVQGSPVCSAIWEPLERSLREGFLACLAE